MSAPAAVRARLPRNVIVFGIVSFLTDVSSEMIAPILPLFLVGLGAGPGFLGLVNGVADATASFLKLASGAAADRARSRKSLVVAGYLLSSVARPLMALAAAPWHVLGLRFADRAGKGIRTSPRDAMVAAATDPSQRGRAFGLHRAMDHAGAMAGSLLCFGLVSLLAAEHRVVFALAAVPGALAVLTLVVFVREERTVPRAVRAARIGERLGFTGPPLPARFVRYLGAVALFALASSSELFLVLKAVEVGIAPGLAVLTWVVLHAVRAALATAGGTLSDRIGRGRLILLGWTIHSATYLGFALCEEPWQFWAVIAVFGTASSLFEGPEKALVSELVADGVRGRAFGLYHFTVGMCALPASLGFGVLWERFGSPVAFVAGAVLAAAAALALAWALRHRAPGTEK
jgi:MFS family permease